MIAGEVQELPEGDSLPIGMVQSVFSDNLALANIHFAGEHVAIGTKATNITITVTAGLSAAAPCTFIQAGAGQLVFVPDTGVTIVSADSLLSTRVQGSFASLVPDLVTPDRYYMTGDIA